MRSVLVISLNLSFEILYLQSTPLSVVVCFSLFVGAFMRWYPPFTIFLQEALGITMGNIKQGVLITIRKGSTCFTEIGQIFHNKCILIVYYLLTGHFREISD